MPKSNSKIARERDNRTPTSDEIRQMLMNLENQPCLILSGETVAIKNSLPNGEPLEGSCGSLTDDSAKFSILETHRANNQHCVMQKKSPSAI
jgi:hypothetical protein